MEFLGFVLATLLQLCGIVALSIVLMLLLGIAACVPLVVLTMVVAMVAKMRQDKEGQE